MFRLTIYIFTLTMYTRILISLRKDVNVTNVKTFETQNGYRAVFTTNIGFNISSEFHKINEVKDLSSN